MKHGHWVVAATKMELAAIWEGIYPLVPMPENPWYQSLGRGFSFSQTETWCLDPKGPWFSISGVGVSQSLMRLIFGAQALQPTLLWQFGIAGAYEKSGLSLGETVCVTQECFGDLGLEIPRTQVSIASSYRSIHEEAWADDNACGPWNLSHPLRDFGLKELAWKSVRGVTVNQVTGTDLTGNMRSQLWESDIETMEGAALALVVNHFHIPGYQIRTISNRAGLRSISPEGIQDALLQLTLSVNALQQALSAGGGK